MISLRRPLSLAVRGAKNFFGPRPLCVSFEVTRSCNARCSHCHLGGPAKEHRAAPGRYADLCRRIKPVVAQVSGGEPMLRRDLDNIIRALKVPLRPPYIILTTNGTLLTKKRWAELRTAGVDEFSLSFDYPDERHDEFRAVPGLFGKITRLMEELKSVSDKGISLSAVVQRDNFHDLLPMADLACQWGVKMNFSTYTWLRTHKKGYMITKEELPELREILTKLKIHKRRHGAVIASDYVLDSMLEFFIHHNINNCRAGERFFVVNPDGTLSPCGLILKKYRSQKEMIEKFTKTNTCGACYTSIRANTEKPARYLIRDSLHSI